MSKTLDLSSLEKLNLQFTLWLEDEYNGTMHSGLGLKPIDRFSFDLKHVKFLVPSETNDELFYAEETRKVKKDNTFSFKNTRYETPVDLHDQEITIRFDRINFGKIIIYYKDQRMGEAKPVDLIINGLLRRKEA